MAANAFSQLKTYLDTQIIGQPELTQALLIAILADGHLLVEGPPGLAKTRAVNALAKGIEGSFQRVQFTPDLLPADVTGTDIYRHTKALLKKITIFVKIRQLKVTQSLSLCLTVNMVRLQPQMQHHLQMVPLRY